ncbi:MAG: tRNA-guanine transglycosylase, partial [bacterium]
RYSRAYIRHLYNQREITALILASYHSTYFYQKLMKDIRASIENGSFSDFSSRFLDRYLRGENISQGDS